MTATITTRHLAGTEVPQAGTFSIDASHSEVGFAVRHLMVSKTRGRFIEFEGTITIADEPSESSVEVSIATASVHTGDEQRDGHLRSGDFFDVEQHPAMIFRSTAVRLSDPSRFEVDGDLTISGVTNPVTLLASYEGVAADPWGGERIAFSARTELDREAWGLAWNQALETGGFLVGKKVTIELEIEAVRAS